MWAQQYKGDQLAKQLLTSADTPDTVIEYFTLLRDYRDPA